MPTHYLFASLHDSQPPRLLRVEGVRASLAGAAAHAVLSPDMLMGLLPKKPAYNHPEGLTNRLAVVGQHAEFAYLAFWDWTGAERWPFRPVVFCSEWATTTDLFEELLDLLTGSFPRYRSPPVQRWRPHPPAPPPERMRRRAPHLRLLDNPDDT